MKTLSNILSQDETYTFIICQINMLNLNVYMAHCIQYKVMMLAVGLQIRFLGQFYVSRFSQLGVGGWGTIMAILAKFTFYEIDRCNLKFNWPDHVMSLDIFECIVKQERCKSWVIEEVDRPWSGWFLGWLEIVMSFIWL